MFEVVRRMCCVPGAGLIALAGADSSLWSVEGGNKLVAEELLRHSRASLLHRRVTHVAPSTHTPGRFMVSDLL